MAITFVGGSYVRDGNGPNVSTDLSSMDSGTIAANDFAILTVMVDQDDLTAITQTAGDTFTLLHYDESSAGRDRGSAMFYRRLTGLEGTVTFEGTGDTVEEHSICLSVWRGVDTTTAFDVTFAAADHYTEGQNNYNLTPDPVTTVTNGAMVILAETITHDDITTAGAPTNYTIAVDGTGTTQDHAQQIHVYREIATATTETPGAFTHTVNNTVAEAQCRTVALRPAPSGPVVTDVETDEEFDDGDTAVTITGTTFEATQGTGKVELGSHSTYTASTTKIAQTVTSWADTSIDFTAVLSTLTPGGLWLYVTNDTGDTNEAGFPVTVHRALAFVLSASANIGTGGTDTTTARLAAPSGKTTGDFDAGRRSDDTSPVPSFTVAADEYTEIEWAIEATADAVDGETYQFRVVLDDGTPLDAYLVTPEWTVASSAGYDLNPATEAEAAGPLSGSKSAALGAVGSGEAPGSLGLALSLPIGPAGEGEGPGSVGLAKAGDAGPAVEGEAAGALSGSKALDLGAVASGEAPGSLTLALTRPIGPASEAEAAGPLAASKALDLGAVASGEAPGSLALVLAQSIGPAVSAEAPGSLTLAKAAALSPVATSEAPGVLSGSKTLPMGPTASGEAPGGLSAAKTLDLSPAVSGESPGVLDLAGSLEIGPAPEGEAPGTLAIVKAVPLGAVASVEAAGSVTAAKALDLGAVASVESPGVLTLEGSEQIGPASEVETAGALSLSKSLPLSPATGVGTAGGLSLAKTAVLAQVASLESARALGASKAVSLPPATSGEAPGGLTVDSIEPLGPATESESAETLALGKAVAVSAVASSEAPGSLSVSGVTIVAVGAAVVDLSVRHRAVGLSTRHRAVGLSTRHAVVRLER